MTAAFLLGMGRIMIIIKRTCQAESTSHNTTPNQKERQSDKNLLPSLAIVYILGQVRVSARPLLKAGCEDPDKSRVINADEGGGRESPGYQRLSDKKFWGNCRRVGERSSDLTYLFDEICTACKCPI